MKRKRKRKRKSLRIMVADDHEVVRHGIRNLLEGHRGWKVCCEASTGKEAVEKARKCRPDVILMDALMPDLDGIEATRQILGSLPQTQIVILTMHESESLLRRALQTGVRGFLVKSESARNLVTAVHTVSDGHPFMCAFALETLMSLVSSGRDRRLASEPSSGTLSHREQQVVRLLAEGNSNKKIAVKLGISIKTVESHRANIMRRLNLSSFSSLVRYAIREGLAGP